MKKNQSNNFSVIFDMDGVVADSIPYHAKAWTEFAASHGLKLTRQTILENFNGRVNKEILEYIFKKKLAGGDIKRYAWEKETLFRKIYGPKVRALKGLLKFLKKLKQARVKVALATAGPPENVNLILSRTKTKKYFKNVINSSNVKLGKPSPEIFLKAAKKLKINPKLCLVFEDAKLGIQAARSAKMRVIAVATSHNNNELSHADLVIKDFSEIGLKKIAEIFYE